MSEKGIFIVSDLISGVAELSAGRLPGEAKNGAELLKVTGFAPLAEAEGGNIAFVANAKALKEAAASKAGVIVVPPDALQAVPELAVRALVVTENPYAWFAWASQIIEGGMLPEPESGVDLRALVAHDAEIDPSARVDAGAVIESGAKIGAHVWIGAGAYVGEKAEIGANSRLFPSARVGDHCKIGERCILNMGCTIGGEGFGFAPFRGEWVKIPQIGAVRIGSDCEIGANTTIDRGALEDTVIGEGSKLDDQVQIGHNCRIGRHCVICGCVGIAGSTTVGDHCVLGGASMINGHINIPTGSMVGPATPIMSWGDKPETMTGIFPAQSHREWERTAVLLRRLGSMRDSLKALKREVETLRSASGER